MVFLNEKLNERLREINKLRDEIQEKRMERYRRLMHRPEEFLAEIDAMRARRTIFGMCLGLALSLLLRFLM